MKIKQVGPWTIISLLGKGGNGEVWQARHANGDVAAIKFLHNISAKRYERFRSEIDIQRKLSGKKGILPVVDADVPDKLSSGNIPWLATPVAEKLVERLKNMDLESTVRAILDIAITLATLAEEGISHRDIKPDNLFWLHDNPVIGDFGLADFPEKNAVTERGEKLGPIYFMAPEMLTNAETADGRVADVYSLAKTLWVLATGQIYLPPGELRTDVPQVRLSTYVDHARAYLLDRLIETATRHDPSKRPTMREVADELYSWQTLPERDPTLPDLTSVAARLDATIGPLKMAEQQKREYINQADAELKRLSERLKLIAERVAEVAPCNGEIGYRGGALANCLNSRVYSGPKVPPESVIWSSSSPCFLVICPDARRIRLECGLGMDLQDNGISHVAGAHFLSVQDTYDMLWCECIEARIGTAKCQEATEQLLNHFNQNLSWALEKFAEAVGNLPS